MMLTQNGKLLYISDNAAEYLGHSMVSLITSNIRTWIFESVSEIISNTLWKEMSYKIWSIHNVSSVACDRLAVQGW